jgi:hypothetical protein
VNASKLTPLGKADSILKEETEGLDPEKTEKYEETLQRYRKVKLAQLTVKILLYASIVTSIATALGLKADFIAKISSYIGTSVLIIIYAVLTYFTNLYRETFYIRRELLVNSQD